MDLVMRNAALYTKVMNFKDTLDEYYQVFKAQVDTTKTHSGKSGYHGAFY